ncbi:hypothetical protein ACFO4O_06450 [Glaciecola siphonariae]|uniref:Uncharacterized protein n=1 Tax=Glaciecola siphonariae TaxID=521012 RepID=A0ABV9LTF4_9ALTE
MDLVNRYISAVQQALPADKQDEIGRELKANILDDIDAMNAQNGGSDDNVQAVLKKYGHPELTANRFYERPALIAGIDMALYKKVLFHGAAFLFTYAVVLTVFAMLQDDSINPIRLLLQSLMIFIDKVSLLFLILTLTFYYLGKSGSISGRLYKTWTLDKLPSDPSFKVSNSDTITDIITNSFLLLILWTHLWMSNDVYQQQVLSLAPSAEHWRIILTVLCVQSLIQALYRLTQTYWQRRSYIAYIVDHAVFALAALFMAATTPIIFVKEEASATIPSMILSFVESSQTHFLLSVAAILVVLVIIQLTKLSRLNEIERD